MSAPVQYPSIQQQFYPLQPASIPPGASYLPIYPSNPQYSLLHGNHPTYSYPPQPPPINPGNLAYTIQQVAIPYFPPNERAIECMVASSSSMQMEQQPNAQSSQLSSHPTPINLAPFSRIPRLSFSISNNPLNTHTTSPNNCINQIDQISERLTKAKTIEEFNQIYLSLTALVIPDKSLMPKVLVAAALLYFQAKQYEDVVEYCNQILQSNSRLYEGYITRGIAYTHLHRFEEGLKDFIQGYSIEVESPDVTIACISACFKRDATLLPALKAIPEDQMSFHSKVLLSVYYISTEEIAKAEETLKEAFLLCQSKDFPTHWREVPYKKMLDGLERTVSIRKSYAETKKKMSLSQILIHD